MSKAKDGKFIVINYKRMRELDDSMPTRDRMGVSTFNREHPANKALIQALEVWLKVYENDTGKKLDQQYIAVNQDEPYADKVWDLVLNKETE